jgi:hypothetical protein
MTPEEQRLRLEQQEGLRASRKPALCNKCDAHEMHSHDWRERISKPNDEGGSP